MYGRKGWIEKRQTADYNRPSESTFLVENLKESAGGLINDTGDSDAYAAMAFVNARPMLEILSPRNNDSVYNSRNVASDTQTLRLHSQGVLNPPSMYVLSVGVSDYDISSQNLTYAKSDAVKIANLFRRQARADIYDKVEVKTLYNEEATRANIKDGINYFLSEARQNDVAVFYFAGHGVTDPRGDYYLLGRDGEIERPSTQGYKNSDLEEDLLTSVYAEKVLVMLDSCRSGQATGRRGSADIDAVVDQLVVASGYNQCGPGQRGGLGTFGLGGGAFTYALVQALEKGQADSDGNGFISVTELNDSAYRRVLDITGGEQLPPSRIWTTSPVPSTR